MECPYGWMTDLSWDEGEGERWDLESELEMQIWRWALLEAHLREASLVYEKLMGSPLAPTAREKAGRTTWNRGTAPNPMETRGAINPGGGRSQGRRQRRRFLQHQKRILRGRSSSCLSLGLKSDTVIWRLLWTVVFIPGASGKR